MPLRDDRENEWASARFALVGRQRMGGGWDKEGREGKSGEETREKEHGGKAKTHLSSL